MNKTIRTVENMQANLGASKHANKQALLTLSQVSLNLGIGGRVILEDISYTVYPGDFVIILGGNGSGKSSLLKIINKMYTQTQGDILLEEKNIANISGDMFTQQVSTVTQDTQDNLFYGFTVFENGLMYELIHENNTHVQSLLSVSNVFKISKSQERAFYTQYLATFCPELAGKLDTDVARLSGGQRQSLALALCLRHKPKLLLLDEHTSALDPKTAQVIMQKTHDYITAHAVTCIMTTHDLDEALRYGNRLVALKAGKIVFMADEKEKQRLTKEQLLHFCY
ncbi:MAG: ATP-binding cassette domain-containing protein [bacterium]